MIKNKHKLEVFVHVLTALVLFLKGFDKIEHHYILAGTVITGFGIVVLGLTFFGEKIGLSHNQTKITTYILESIALYITAFVSFNESKKFIPYFFLLSAVMYTIAVLVFYNKKMKQTNDKA